MPEFVNLILCFGHRPPSAIVSDPAPAFAALSSVQLWSVWPQRVRAALPPISNIRVQVALDPNVSRHTWTAFVFRFYLHPGA